MKRLWKDLASGQPAPIPTVGEVLERKLRKWVCRLGRPDFLEQMRYRLDRDGIFNPDAPPPDLVLKALCEKLFAGRWWEGRDANAGPQ